MAELLEHGDCYVGALRQWGPRRGRLPGARAGQAAGARDGDQRAGHREHLRRPGGCSRLAPHPNTCSQNAKNGVVTVGMYILDCVPRNEARGKKFAW